MIRYIVFLFTVLFFFSCSVKKNGDTVPAQTDTADKQAPEAFFPVTNYLKGQIIDIKESGVNPLKYTTANNKTDSVWLKMEQLENEMQPFLEPVIDTLNLASFFVQSKFLDQTLNTFTFSYDPAGQLPADFSLLHWDVYVDPKTNRVSRVYMVKKASQNKTIQLTWQSDKWCKIVTISNDNSAVEKEILIKWDF